MCRYSAHPLSSIWAAEDQCDCTGRDMADCQPSESGPETPDDWWLRPSRIDSYLADPNLPFAASAETFRIDSERRKRALAEIDGVVAGLKFLDKLERDDDDDHPTFECRESTTIDPMFRNYRDYDRSIDLRLPAEINLDDLFNREPEVDPPVGEMGDASKAWRGLGFLRRGMKAEFRRFDDVAYRSASPTIRRLRSRFPSFRALADCGTLVYRDVLDGLCPGTLEEIFAFASLSHAMSQILVRQKRMEEAQVLSGVQRWRDCIDNGDERSVFDTLASSMWPSSCVSSTRPEQAASSSHSQANPVPEGWENASQFLQKVATIAATEMGHLPSDASHRGDAGLPLASVEEDVLNLTGLTGEEFDFSQLRRFGDSDAYVPPKGIDPRELSKFCAPSQPIPGYSLSPLCPPLLGDPPMSTPPAPDCQMSPSPSSSTSHPSGGQRLYHFPVTDEVFDCKAINLRNTITILAVLAFASDSGGAFYLFSGSGKTAIHSRNGSAWASERSKAERRLRREFFDPLKKAGADDASFLALLAVAKKFVVLGLLGTENEVQDYLIAISKEFLTCGSRQAKFVRWIFGQSPGSMAANSSKPTQPGTPAQQNKRRDPPETETQLGDDGPTKKKQRIYRCEHPGCGYEYHSASGLSKHKKKHVPVTQVVYCDSCEYSSNRRDLVRQHFLRQHGEDLPPSLQEIRRGHR
ncbi:hypothetical protein B0I37DRAFT_384656 [Chaetomium sp. MPI-CAGE-AT-0009]|nr:hypothetical protein B0I37DRAFT_384656 [Chaetomium sp. MPI-CAGE-AT-0009]